MNLKEQIKSKARNYNSNLLKDQNNPQEPLNINEEKIKNKLIKDYGLSEKKAEETTKIIIKKAKQKHEENPKLIRDTPNPQTNKKININSSDVSKDSKNVIKSNINNNNTQSNETKTENINQLLMGIIPDYGNEVSIELQHVDLSFDMVDEKIDTLKELFIKQIQRNKSKKFKFKALKDISFTIYKGEKVGIIGYNGAGKSTLLNVITGIYPPDKGYVKTNGNISPLLSLGAGFDFNYSGRKNIILNGAILGYDKQYLEQRIDDIIEFTELGEFIDVPIKNYSSGMLAKLGFSIATAVNPDILIIDEILGVGDVNFQKKSRDKIKSLIDGGTTVLIVSHSIPFIRTLCDKAIWIDNGKVREIGEVNQVCDHYLKDAEKASKEQLSNIKFK